MIGHKCISNNARSAPDASNYVKLLRQNVRLFRLISSLCFRYIPEMTKVKENDTKSKHRISDARWRDSVSRCYNLLKHCSYADQESTRMAILRLTHDQIKGYEKQVQDLSKLELVSNVFAQGEILANQQNQITMDNS